MNNGSVASHESRNVFIVLAAFFYAAYAILTPPFQNPDEHQHLLRAWQLSEFTLIGEHRGDQAGGVLPGGIGAAAVSEIGTLRPHFENRPVPVRAFMDWRATSPSDREPQFYNFLGSAIYSPFSYVPQVLAIWTGRLFDFSVENILRLGRLLNAVLAITLIAVAISLAPYASYTFLFIGLLPPTIASSTSFGQDGLVIGSSCILVATGLRLALLPAARRERLLLVTSGIVVTLTKIVYFPLIFTAGLFRAAPGRDRRERLLLLGLAGAVAIGATMAWMAVISPVAIRPQSDMPPPLERFLIWAADPASFLGPLWFTYVTRGDFLLGSAFTFGWINVGPVLLAQWATLIALVMLILLGDRDGVAPSLRLRGWLLLLALGTTLLLSFVLYIYYSPPVINRVRGMQGRYLIPILALALPALVPARTTWKTSREYMLVLLVCANLICLFAIVVSYYSF